MPPLHDGPLLPELFHSTWTRPLYLFTSGRFEPKNKGFDLCLEAMARLNWETPSGAGLDVTRSSSSSSPHGRPLDPPAGAGEARRAQTELRGVVCKQHRRFLFFPPGQVGNRCFRRGRRVQGSRRSTSLVDEYSGSCASAHGRLPFRAPGALPPVRSRTSSEG
jgi:hypothetical protein